MSRESQAVEDRIIPHSEELLETAIENIKKGLHPFGHRIKADENGEPLERYGEYKLLSTDDDCLFTLLQYERRVKNGERWIVYEKVAHFEKSIGNHALRNRLINARFPYSTVLSVLSSVDFEREAMKHYREYAENPTQVLTITGECGTGKTYGAVWLALEMLRSRKVRTTGFVKSSDLDGYMRTRIDDDLPEVPSRNVDLLVIDDLCSEIVTGVIKDQACRLIDYRLGRGLRTVITTNLGIDDIDKLYGERVASRLSRDDARLVQLGASDSASLFGYETSDKGDGSLNNGIDFDFN